MEKCVLPLINNLRDLGHLTQALRH